MTTDIFSYKDLTVWQKSIVLVKSVYSLTSSFPSEEKYSLVSQMRRAAVSIPSNIAEGKSRRTKKDYRSFIINASASGSELETQLIISKELAYGNKIEVEKIELLLTEVKKMLSALISSLT